MSTIEKVTGRVQSSCPIKVLPLWRTHRERWWVPAMAQLPETLAAPRRDSFNNCNSAAEREIQARHGLAACWPMRCRKEAWLRGARPARQFLQCCDAGR